MRKPTRMTTDFPNDNGLGNSAMKQRLALAEAQNRARAMRCPDHNQPAIIRIAASGQLSVAGCCESFQSSVSEVITRQIK